jgi:hypothetical protein
LLFLLAAMRIDLDDVIEWFISWVVLPILLIGATLCLLVALWVLADETLLNGGEHRAEAQHQSYISTYLATGANLPDCELRFLELRMLQDSIRASNNRMDSGDAVAMQSILNSNTIR